MKTLKQKLKGGHRKMKIQIAIIALLIGSIFAGTFALADRDQKFRAFDKAKDNFVKIEFKGKAIGLDEIDTFEIENEDKEQTLEKVENALDKRKLGFAESWKGTGYINNGEKGYLISAFWILQKFSNNESNASEENLIERAFGNLKVIKAINFKLILKERSNNSINFYILDNFKNGVNQENAKENSIGTLILNKKDEFIGLIIWEGTLELTSGELSGNWKVNLATDNNVVKPSVSNETEKKEIKCESIENGDANADGKVDISDAVYINLYLKGKKSLRCPNKADANGDGKIDEKDRDYLIDFLFEGGSSPVKGKFAEKIIAKAEKFEEKGKGLKIGFWARFRQFILGK